MKSIVGLLMLVSIAVAQLPPALVLEKLFVKIGTFNYIENGIGLRKTYYVSRGIELSWAESLTFCRAFGMDIVNLPTEEEANVFLKFTLDNGQYYDYVFVGATYIGNGANNFYWINTGLPVKYPIKFDVGEPSNSGGRENCLSLTKKTATSFVYNDIDCFGKTMKFACEYIAT
ncbi:unnamed protein product [Diamesa tonsa]